MEMKRNSGHAPPRANTTKASALVNTSNVPLKILKPLKIGGHQSLSAHIINPNVGHFEKTEKLLRNSLGKGACLEYKMNIGKESEPVFRRVGVVVTLA